MKKIFALIMAAAVLLSLVGCSGDDTDSSAVLQLQQEIEQLKAENDRLSSELAQAQAALEQMEKEAAAQPELTPEPTPEPVFEPNADLRIVHAFVFDGDTYLVIENVGDQPVLNFRVAYANFDKNGFLATTDSAGYKTGKSTSANLMPGEKHIFGWSGAKGDYASAAIISAEYADGSVWETAYIDLWAKTAAAEFSVDAQKAAIEAMKADAALAETNEFAQLSDLSIKHGNSYSAQHDLHFSVENLSAQGIAKLNVFVLEFDENGFPVSVNPYSKYCINGHSTGGTVNLASGESGSYSDDLFLFPETTQIKIVISYIEFQDGSQWENPWLYEWIIANNRTY